MRRGEILGLKWVYIEWENKRVLLPHTKNRRARWVPLSNLVLRHIGHAPKTADRAFPITCVAVRRAWDRSRKRAGILDWLADLFFRQFDRVIFRTLVS